MKIILSLILLLAQPVWAAFSNYNSILIGDLTAGLSGAGTAVLGDVSSASFYNPALLGPLKGSSFSAAVGIYKKYDTVYNKKEDLFAAPGRINKGYFRSLPAATGSMIERFGYKWALSIVTPDYDQFAGRVIAEGDKIKSLNITDESIWVGGSVSKNIDESSSWGVTLYYTARNLTRTESERDVPAPNELDYRASEKRVKENALVPVVGYFKKLDDKWAVGVSGRFMLMRIAGKGDVKETNIDVTGGVVTINTPEFGDLESEFFVPARLNLGVSYNSSPTSLWAFDVNIHEGFSFYDLDSAAGRTLVRNQAVVNYSLGYEKAFKDWLKLRTGIFTNFSAHPNPNPNLNVDQMDRVDMLGFSANMVLISEDKIAYTFGGYYTGGWGRSLQNTFGNYEVVSKKQNVFTMLVGTSFYF